MGRIIPEQMPAKYKPNFGPLNFMHAAPTNEWLRATSDYNNTTVREKLLRRTVFNAAVMTAFSALALEGMNLAMHDNAAWYWPTAVIAIGAAKKAVDIFSVAARSPYLND